MMLVIGYGNSLRGDDGLGPYVIECLSRDAPAGEVEFFALRQLTPELAEPISRARVVIFVDSRFGAVPGQIECQALSPSDNLSQSRARVFTHNAHPLALLDSAGALYGHCPLAYLYSVTGQTFTLGVGFSPAVQSAIPPLLSMLKDKLLASTQSLSVDDGRHDCRECCSR